MKDLGLRLSSIRRLCVLAGACFLASAGVSDQFLPVLETKTGTYSNVTVTLKTARGVHIRHERGIANIALEDIDDEAKVVLGYMTKSGKAEESTEAGGGIAGEWLNTLRRASPTSSSEGEVTFEIPAELNQGLIWLVLAVGLVIHFFFAYCSRLICIKAGSDPGFMIWLPVLQIFPLFRAAGMSGWWFLGMLVPGLNLVVQILWCIKIVQARSKHVIWAILLIIPLANVIAFLYLAFSDDEGSRDSVDLQAYSPRPI